MKNKQKQVNIPRFNKTQLYKKVPEFIKQIRKGAKIGRGKDFEIKVAFKHDPDKAEKAIKEFIKFLKE